MHSEKDIKKLLCGKTYNEQMSYFPLDFACNYGY